MKHRILFGTIAILLAMGPSHPVFAQEETSAKQHAALADMALEAGKYDEALLELDRATRIEPKPLYIYKRILVLEAMDEPAYALKLLEDHRAALSEAEGVENLFIVEERLRTAVDNPKPSVLPPPTSRSAVNMIGPILLGAIGVSLGAFSVYGFAASCEVESTHGDCLQGESANMAVTVGTGAGAVLAITGAIVWWVLGTPVSPSDDTIRASNGGMEVAF